MDIWQRDVPWSSVKQLRSVAETEFSADDAYFLLVDNFERKSHKAKDATNLAKKHAKSETLKQAYKDEVVPFVCMQEDVATCLQYREIPLPW